MVWEGGLGEALGSTLTSEIGWWPTLIKADFFTEHVAFAATEITATETADLYTGLKPTSPPEHLYRTLTVK